MQCVDVNKQKHMTIPPVMYKGKDVVTSKTKTNENAPLPTLPGYRFLLFHSLHPCCVSGTLADSFSMPSMSTQTSNSSLDDVIPARAVSFPTPPQCWTRLECVARRRNNRS